MLPSCENDSSTELTGGKQHFNMNLFDEANVARLALSLLTILKKKKNKKNKDNCVAITLNNQQYIYTFRELFTLSVVAFV